MHNETTNELEIELEDLKTEKARAAFIARKPDKAGAIIIAELRINESDMQTDYHGHTTGATVAIGWRTGKRENFKQLRKAAGEFSHTAHLGIGRDIYEAHSGEDQSHPNPWSTRKRLCGLPDEHNFDGNDIGSALNFTTEAEAIEAAKLCIKGALELRAALEAGELKSYCCGWGLAVLDHGYTIEHESVENRENYSMGGGNYLGYSRHGGWVVQSRDLKSHGREYGIDPETLKGLNASAFWTPSTN